MGEVDLSDSRQTEVFVVAWVMTGLAIFTVGIRLFAQVKIVRSVGWDDFFIFFSLILSIVASSLVHRRVVLGLGRHTVPVINEHGVERLSMIAKYQMVEFPFHVGAFSFPNISIAALVCRFLEPNPKRTLVLYSMSVLQVIFALITIVLAFVQCQPHAKLWEKTLAGTCWSPNILEYFSYWFCAYTAFTDLVLALAPIRAFWSLQMPHPTKIGVCVMMIMTILSAVVTIIKGAYLPLFTDTIDPLYRPVPLVLWGLVEQNIVIMSACMCTMRPFLHPAWNRDAISGHSRPNRNDPFSTFSRSHVDHQKLSSTMDMGLEQLEKDDIMSQDSRSGITRTVEVSMAWRTDSRGKAQRDSENIVPRAILDSEC